MGRKGVARSHAIRSGFTHVRHDQLLESKNGIFSRRVYGFPIFPITTAFRSPSWKGHHPPGGAETAGTAPTNMIERKPR